MLMVHYIFEREIKKIISLLSQNHKIIYVAKTPLGWLSLTFVPVLDQPCQDFRLATWQS